MNKAQTQLIAELDRWLGTPWHHCGSRSGPPAASLGRGGDCVHIPAQAFTNCGLAVGLQLPAYEAMSAFIDSDRGSLAEFFRDLGGRHLVRRVVMDKDGLEPGDLLLFRFASRAHHLGVFKGGRNRMFYHSGVDGSRTQGTFHLSSLREGHYQHRLVNTYRVRSLE